MSCEWFDVRYKLPNEDTLDYFDQYFHSQDENQNSDDILAIDKCGNYYIGFFSCRDRTKHDYWNESTEKFEAVYYIFHARLPKESLYGGAIVVPTSLADITHWTYLPQKPQ